MNSLSQLNTYSDTLLPYTDLRTAKVVFDRLAGTARTVNFSTGDQHTLPIGLNITEIVLPDEEDVYFQVDVNASPGASASFPTLPAGYTAVEVSTQVFRVSNIQSAADWNLIKNVVINIASNFKTNWNYTATIGYESGLTKSWTVAATWTTYTQMAAAFNATASVAAAIGKKSTVASALSSRFTISAKTIEYSLIWTSSLSTTANYRTRGLGAQLNATAFVSATGQGIVSNIISRNYVANSAYAIFAADTPQITDSRGTPSTDTYVFTISSPTGEFGTTTTASSSYSITGTRAVVNAGIPGIRYYSIKNSTANTTYTVTVTRNGSSIFTSTQALNFGSTAIIAGSTILTFTQPAFWTPTIFERNYANIDYLVVAGGGGGGYNGGLSGRAGGGGGAGAVRTGTISAGLLANTGNIIVSVGSGGAGQTSLPATGPGSGDNGNSSGISTSGSFSGITAAGGLGGQGNRVGFNAAAGGTSGHPYSGGLASFGTGYMAAGGGGGSSGNGQQGQTLDFDPVNKGGDGGPGTTNNISGTSVIYAYGGGGGISWDGNSARSGTRGASYTTAGSGGAGGGGLTTGVFTPTAGKNGIVILKVYY